MSIEYPSVPESESFHAPAKQPIHRTQAVERRERQFGLNDIILPEDELIRAKEDLKELGVTSTEQVFSEREVDPEGKSWRPGEFVLSLKDATTNLPLERDAVLRVIDSLRASVHPITIRLAVI